MTDGLNNETIYHQRIIFLHFFTLTVSLREKVVMKNYRIDFKRGRKKNCGLQNAFFKSETTVGI